MAKRPPGKSKPDRIDRDERVSLYPLEPETAIAALLKTPPPDQATKDDAEESDDSR